MPDAIGPLTELTAQSPWLLRVVVGLVGFVLLVAGARVYRVALLGSAFALGAVATAVGLAWAGQQVVALARPEIIGVGALVAGLACAGGASLAHRVALLAIGAIAGLGVGAGVGDLVGGAALLWAPLAGAVLGALMFPWVFPALLKVLTPAVGAVCLAWAAGKPDTLWLIGALWAFGAVVQLVGGRGRSGGGAIAPTRDAR